MADPTADGLTAEPLTLDDTDPIRRTHDYLHVHVRTHGPDTPIATIDESGRAGGHHWKLTPADLGRALVAALRHTTYEGMNALRAAEQQTEPTAADDATAIVEAFLDAQDAHVLGEMPVATTTDASGCRRELPRSALRALIADRDRLREQVDALTMGTETPYRAARIDEITDADRIRILTNLVRVSTRTAAAERKRHREERDRLRAAIARINRVPLHAHDHHWCAIGHDLHRALGDAAPEPTGEQVGGLLAGLAARTSTAPAPATAERGGVIMSDAEQAATRIAALMERLTDSDAFTIPRTELDGLLDERKRLRAELGEALAEDARLMEMVRQAAHGREQARTGRTRAEAERDAALAALAAVVADVTALRERVLDRAGERQADRPDVAARLRIEAATLDDVLSIINCAMPLSAIRARSAELQQEVAGGE